MELPAPAIRRALALADVATSAGGVYVQIPEGYTLEEITVTGKPPLRTDSGHDEIACARLRERFASFQHES